MLKKIAGASGDGGPKTTEDFIKVLFRLAGIATACDLKKGSEIGGPFASLVQG